MRARIVYTMEVYVEGEDKKDIMSKFDSHDDRAEFLQIEDFEAEN